MADDIALSTGNQVGPPTGTTIATDTISSRAIQEVGIILGPHGTNNGRLEGNTELAALLASASRNTTTNTPDQSTPSHKGALFLLDVTASTAAKTLGLKVQAKDPVSGNYVDIYDFGTVVTSAGSAVTVACLLYPAADDTDFAGAKALKGNLPKTWRAVVTPSDATAWTYSLAAVGLA